MNQEIKKSVRRLSRISYELSELRVELGEVAKAPNSCHRRCHHIRT